MMQQSKVGLEVSVPLRLRDDLKLREGILSGLPPVLDGGFYLGSPEQIRRRWGRASISSRGGVVQVIAADLVLSTVAAGRQR